MEGLDREITPERLRREIAAIADLPDPPARGRPRRRSARPSGLLTSMESWLADHEATAGRSVIASFAQPAAASSPFLTVLLGALAELMQAFLRTEEAGLDALLDRRPPLLTPRIDGLARCALLTPVTDRDALIRELFGRVPRRPRYVSREPTVPVEVGRADTEEVREMLGLSVGEMADLYRARTLTPPVRRMLLERALPRMLAHDPALVLAMQQLMAQSPAAVTALPTADLLFALVRGVRRPGKRLAHQFVQTVELGAHGIVAMVFWNPGAADRRRVRNDAAAYVRYVADFAVAPWNRWPDLRRRREALCLYGRRLARMQPGIDDLAERLRRRYPEAYAEPLAKTRRRLYVLSAHTKRARLPRASLRLS